MYVYGLIENKSWSDLISFGLQRLRLIPKSQYTSWTVLWVALDAFLSDDVQVNIRMACSHGELWFCPLGWKFTKPGAGLWWTLFLVLPFLCPLRCNVTSAHQREAPYRVHLMLLSPTPNTHSHRPTPLTHTYSSQRITLYIWKKKTKNESPVPSVYWFPCPLLSWCFRKWLTMWLSPPLGCETKIEYAGQRDRCPRQYMTEKDATTQRRVCAPGQRWSWMSLVSPQQA